MKRRSFRERFTPAALVFFLAAVAAPRPGVLVHHHAGGEHAHVHLDGDHVPPDDDHDAPPHQHGALRPGEAALEAPEGAETWHARWQHPFQRAARAAAPRLVRAERVALLPNGLPPTPFAAPSRATHARAPPPSAGS